MPRRLGAVSVQIHNHINSSSSMGWHRRDEFVASDFPPGGLSTRVLSFRGGSAQTPDPSFMDNHFHSTCFLTTCSTECHLVCTLRASGRDVWTVSVSQLTHEASNDTVVRLSRSASERAAESELVRIIDFQIMAKRLAKTGAQTTSSGIAAPSQHLP